jgi:riboflavin synthase
MIPHTAKLTTLGAKHAGDSVNLETDLIGKYVEKLLAGRIEGGISLELLQKNGFA